MTFPFDPQQGLIVVPAELWGPTGSVVLRLALDTDIRALGQERVDFGVLGHTLPPSAGVDGLLGPDFLRGQSLTIDFRGGRVNLA